ncbi:MAG: T9SS type A sorting domain-containing protein [Saprospiraceae bacterium]|nr:T9SS type A sorting domain-containing protein [Saprospiraceae bacterium]
MNGNTVFKKGFFVDEDNVYFFNDNNLYVFDANTKIITLVKSFSEYCCYQVFIYKNHLAVFLGSGNYEIYTKDYGYISSVNSLPYITENGQFINIIRTHQGEGKYGNKIDISSDYGKTYSELYNNSKEEYRIIGSIDDRLYFRGFITQGEAWSNGHTQARMGYIDVGTGEIIQIFDGNNNKRNNSPMIVGQNLFHNIDGAIIKYPNGDFSDRQVLFRESNSPTPIKKLRVTDDGAYYAMTKTFLYKSDDNGKQWKRLLNNYSAVDFDINENQNLYCISNDQILKSTDQGNSFSTLSINYPKGNIDYPYEIICAGGKNLIVKGTGHYIKGMGFQGCFDCYLNYPDFIFTSQNDGLSWDEKYVYHWGYPNISAAEIYRYPSNIAIQSSYYLSNSSQLLFLDNNQFSIVDKTNFEQINTSLPFGSWPNDKYGLSIKGDIIKNTKGQISYSKDSGITYQDLSATNHGKIYPGFSPESLFIISEEDNSKGSLSFQYNYNTPFVPLSVILKDSWQVILDSFDTVYTDGWSNYLFSDSNCYKIETIDINSKALDEEVKIFNNFYKIYPNPVSETLTINKINDNSSKTQIKIFNNKLKLINSIDFEKDNFQMDTKELLPGIYYIIFSNHNGSFGSKFIKI